MGKRLESLLNWASGRTRARRQMQAAYEVIKRRSETDSWKYATSDSANAIDTPETRRELRDLSRYEEKNNPHLRGLLLKLDHAVIGKGPRLEIEPVSSSKPNLAGAKQVETMFAEHAEASGFVKKLNLFNHERMPGGESIAVIGVNRKLEVPVDFTVYEGDQFSTPQFEWDGQEEFIDGIELDAYGNPAFYNRLKRHPGASNGHYGFGHDDYDSISAEVVAHMFRQYRPSQYRGIPEVAPTLDVYQKLRRFIESKVSQEELRSRLLGVIETGFQPDLCADVGNDPIQMLINGGQFMNMPDGWKANMFKFDSTGQGCLEFMRCMLSWATQALLAPWNITSGDSSDYNFASGRLDFSMFYGVADELQCQTETTLLNPYFDQWSSVAQELRVWPAGLGEYRAKWYWPVRPAIDTAKQATTDIKLNEAGLLDVGEYAQRQYQMSANDFMRQQAKNAKFKQDMMEEFGVKPVIPATANPFNRDPAEDPENSQQAS